MLKWQTFTYGKQFFYLITMLDIQQKTDTQRSRIWCTYVWGLSHVTSARLTWQTGSRSTDLLFVSSALSLTQNMKLNTIISVFIHVTTGAVVKAESIRSFVIFKNHQLFQTSEKCRIVWLQCSTSSTPFSLPRRRQNEMIMRPDVMDGFEIRMRRVEHKRLLRSRRCKGKSHAETSDFSRNNDQQVAHLCLPYLNQYAVRP